MGDTVLRSVVVTGAGSGIGQAVALRLIADDWAVVAVDRDGPPMTAALQPAIDAGRPVRTVIGDVADRETHREARRAAVALAPLGASVGCAGLTRAHPLTRLEESAVRELVDVNQFGLLWGAAEAVDEFTTTGTPGAVIVISSVHGRHAHPDHAVYEMTKAAADALVRNIAVSYGSHGIRAVAVAPGAVRTPALLASVDSTDDPAAARRHLECQSPARRLAEPVEVAAAVAFLISDEAQYISGTVLTIDGGLSAVLMAGSGDPRAHRPGRQR